MGAGSSAPAVDPMASFTPTTFLALEELVAATLPDSILALLPITAMAVGIACLLAQIFFWALFAFVLPAGPWKDEAGFTAHQAVVLPLITYLAYWGVVMWRDTPLLPAFGTAVARATKAHAVGSHLTQIAIGELIIWDTPTCFLVPSLRSPEMLAHHILMAGVAYLSYTNTAFQYYTLLYFGAIEVSGILLCWVDVCHPKHKPWCEFADRHPALGLFNLVTRGLFLVLYFTMRLGFFPYYMFVARESVLLDIAELLRLETPVLPAFALWGIGTFGFALTLLQFYWGYLLVKQVQKMLKGDDKKKKKTN
jgi:hypothetical protein